MKGIHKFLSHVVIEDAIHDHTEEQNDQNPSTSAGPQTFHSDLRSLIPHSFSRLQVTGDIVQNEINSQNSFDSVIEMLSNGNSYLLEGPNLVGKDLIFRVKSESDDDVSYKVKISPKGPLCKRKNEVYKNYNYKCECPVKKVGLI